MLPQRPTGSYSSPSGIRKSGPISHPGGAQSYDAIKTRVLAKLEDRMDPASSKRMPLSLLRQSLRTFADQIADQECRGLPRPERDRIVEEVLAELLGYGPLEELFKDATVREVMVVGPHAVIVRREQCGWMPCSVRFRDEGHLRTALDRLATHADVVGGLTASTNLFDIKLPNGFRAVGVVPPPALEVSASVAFVRVEVPAVSVTPAPLGTGSQVGPSPTGSASVAAWAAPDSPTASPRPGANPGTGSYSRMTDPPADPIVRHKNRIIERLVTKLASRGVYDVKRLEINEFRRVVAAYVAEYLSTEKVYLTDTDEGRLQLEILTTMHR